MLSGMQQGRVGNKFEEDSERIFDYGSRLGWDSSTVWDDFTTTGVRHYKLSKVLKDNKNKASYKIADE